MRNLYFAALAIVLVFVLVVSVVWYTSRADLTPKEARRNWRSGKYDYVVDVRTEAEWTTGHLPNTMSIPIGAFVTELPKRIPNKDARILFVCKRGIRAKGVAEMAKQMGYTNVQAMTGNYQELEGA